MQDYIDRILTDEIKINLLDFPVVAILGPRQCGKSTLAKKISEDYKNSVFLDLEKYSDLKKIENPEFYFKTHQDNLIFVDEIQRKPDLFPILRSIIDENNKTGQMVLLGSASRDLIKQSSETLAGRICYMELTPFIYSELIPYFSLNNNLLIELWIRGGYPRSYLSRNDKGSYRWRINFIRTFLERDIPQLGIQVPSQILERFWRMIAHTHGQLLNSSKLGESLGVSHMTIRSYIDILVKTYVLRILPPFLPNLKKRLIKSPKIYIRDSGLLHTLLEIETMDDLLGHPIIGSSWEGFVIENILSRFPQYRASFYRTSSGSEIDLIIEKGRKKYAVECKTSSAPNLSRGFWNALEVLKPDKTWIITPTNEKYLIKENITISSLKLFIQDFELLT